MSSEKFAQLLRNLRGGTLFVREVGQRIRQERKALALTLSAAGKRLGISHAYLCEIEKGKKPPPYRVLEGVSSWRSRDLEWLLFGEESPATELVAEEGQTYTARRPPKLPVVGTVGSDDKHRAVWEPVEPPDWYELPGGAKLVEVRGDALRPVALDGQHLVVVEGTASNGELVAVELKDGIQLFRRWWWDEAQKRATLESVTPDTAEPPIAVTPRQVARVWRIIGVLF